MRTAIANHQTRTKESIMSNLRPVTWLLILSATVLLTACGGGNGGDQAPGTNIVITGNDLMQFSVNEFTVKAGSEVTVQFRNIGEMPKAAMGHNIAFLTRGTDPDAFSASSQRHPDNEYIDPALMDKVLAATRILGPGEEQTLRFTAPRQPGDYPYVCSFPAHTMAGMKGVMKVE
jgi:azurin